jgi:ubiquinone/menaquinone biosynthesis C-methylase UbiE
MPLKHREHSSEYLGAARAFWWNEDYLDLLAKRLRLNACHSLLDVGCGQGYMAFKLAGRLARNASVYGIDAEAKWVGEAEDQAKTFPNSNVVNFKFIPGDACNLPFADNSMDISLCQTLLIHLAEPEKAVAEMVRVTRPGGHVVAFEPNNIVNSLILNSQAELNNSVEQTMMKVEIQLRMEKGKMALGEGFDSLGDVVPELFHRAGLCNIQVWLGDKAGVLIPPYDTAEKKARRDELLGWMVSGQANYDYDQRLRHYTAGGGAKADFDLFWQTQESERLRSVNALQHEKYISVGGQMLYIIAGTKQVLKR